MKQYFSIKGKKVPKIAGGSVEYLGSTLSVSFEGGFSYNPNTSKSTDILFLQLGLGEGPVYRINPNGPQDIEIDDKYIDDLVDFTTNNTKSDVFVVQHTTGTLFQKPLPAFSAEISTPVRFTTPVVLKSGISTSFDVPAPPETSVLFFPTNSSEGLTPIDSIRIKFIVKELRVSSGTEAEPAQLGLVALVHSRDETADLNNYIAGSGMIVNSLVSGSMATEIELKIPEERKASEGYNISILKITEDVGEDNYVSEVETIGFDEIRKEPYSYPGTALVGYAIKATDFRSDTIPIYTSLLKGLIVDVPSNYNQPILESGEVDWRQIEVPSTGSNSAAVRGYRLQNTGKTLQNSSSIKIYDGIWDGTYKKDWTENRVWIIRHILVEILGLPESVIDKYNFYSTAQYCDAVDPSTGIFVGVNGFADGSFRYKPNGYATETINTLLGLPEGTSVKERRFVCGLSITDISDGWDLISALASGMRATISTSGGKIRFIIDKPNSLPVALFNETNISANSFKISGIRAEDIPYKVEVSYIDLPNHFVKDTISIEAFDTLKDSTELSIDGVGITRKSEALRLAQYHLNISRASRRKIQFTAFSDASDLDIGDIIGVSHVISGLNYGYGGVVFSNTTAGTSNAFIEYFGVPAINSSTITSNTLPIVLKIFSQETNELNYYLVSNSAFTLSQTSNSSFGADVIELNILSKFDPTSLSFTANSQFSIETAPKKGDLWALGEMNPGAIYTDTSTKLFRVESLEIENSGYVNISGTEYNSNVIANIDNVTSYIKTPRSGSQNYLTPPTPILSLNSIPSKNKEGIIAYNLVLSSTTDSTNYTVPISTTMQYGYLDTLLNIESVQ
jgi:hypothetical protein